jgi:hypothetical protein
MKITALGRELMAGDQPGRELKHPAKTPHIPDLGEILGPHVEHEEDRPRYHLRHAALLALASLQKERARTRADDCYEMMLQALSHDRASTGEADVDGQAEARADQEVFDSLSPSWKNDIRKRLMECLVRFQDVVNRRESGSDLVALAEKVKPGPEAILWASAAIDLAHHYSFAPASQLDRLTARRLLRQAKDLLLKSAVDHPELQVATTYRLGKASKVAELGWTAPAAARSAAVETPAEGEPDRLAAAIDSLDTKVSRSGEFNRVLESLDRSLSTYLGRWIMSAHPSTEWIFRSAGGVGIAKEIDEWGREMGKRGTLNELILPHVQSNEPLKQELQQFIVNAGKFSNDDFSLVVQPHIDQARALLGEPVNTSRLSYEDMLLNNLWSPEMVAAHAIAAASSGGDKT